MSSLLKKEKGFTLIEVVIVLAIAALVILVVLQAVGAANKSNRDTTRKTEAGRIVSLLEQYASNNGGKYPAAATTLTDGTHNATGITTTGSLYPYDGNLSQKYQTVVGNAYVAGSAISGTCPAITNTTYTIIYQVSPNLRDYKMGVCLESGGLSSLRNE